MIRANQAAKLDADESGVHVIRSENAPLPDQMALKEMLSAAGIPVVPAMLKLHPSGDVHQFVRHLLSQDQFVLKAARNHSMADTLVVSGRQEDAFKTNRGELFTRESLTQHILNIVTGEYSLGCPDVAFAEPRLTPDDFFSAFYPVGLSNVHIDFQQRQIARCAIILPTLSSEGRARLYLGAIALAVRPDTGVTWHASQGGQDLLQHPENGLRLINIIIPKWSEIIRLAKRVATLQSLPDLRIRIAIDRHRGPLVLSVSK